MDKRETFKDVQQLQALLQAHLLHKEKASFLIDRDGLTRIEGTILKIEETNSEPFVVLAEGEKLLLSEIVAVNGVFQSDYSEC